MSCWAARHCHHELDSLSSTENMHRELPTSPMGTVIYNAERPHLTGKLLFQIPIQPSSPTPESDTPAKGGGLVNVTTSKVVGLNYVDL
jgi:hypothetical protein